MQSQRCPWNATRFKPAHKTEMVLRQAGDIVQGKVGEPSRPSGRTCADAHGRADEHAGRLLDGDAPTLVYGAHGLWKVTRRAHEQLCETTQEAQQRGRHHRVAACRLRPEASQAVTCGMSSHATRHSLSTARCSTTVVEHSGQASLGTHVATCAERGLLALLCSKWQCRQAAAHLLERREPAIPVAQALQAWLYKVLRNDLRMGEVRQAHLQAQQAATRTLLCSTVLGPTGRNSAPCL